jgi:hypothetical protein
MDHASFEGPRDKMELPSEIVAIIRVFSRPRFKYFREYNRFVEMKREWPALRTMLQTDPGPVLPLLMLFEQFILEWVDSKRLFKQWDYTLPFELYKTLERDYYEKRSKLIQVEQELHLLLKEPYVCRV